MAESADLSDITDAIGSLTNDFTNAFKTINSPTSTVVPGSAVPGRPGYVYGPGGSIQAVSPVTGLPVQTTQPIQTGTIGIGTVLLIVAIAVLGFALFARK